MNIKHKPYCTPHAPVYNPVYGVLACQWCGASVQYRTLTLATTSMPESEHLKARG